MELKSFRLENYSDSKQEHRSIIIQLWNDKLSHKYLYDLSKEIELLNELYIYDKKNKAFIVYYEDKPIGYISLMSVDNKCTISYGLIPEYRGKHLCTNLLREFTYEVLKTYEDINKLSLIICNDNIGSQKVAKNAGYEKETIIRYSKYRKMQ